MPIALYQMGIIRHLPELPLPRLNADVVDAASEAHAILATPDALLGLGSGATPSRPGECRWTATTGRGLGHGFPWPSLGRWCWTWLLAPN